MLLYHLFKLLNYIKTMSQMCNSLKTVNGTQILLILSQLMMLILKSKKVHPKNIKRSTIAIIRNRIRKKINL